MSWIRTPLRSSSRPPGRRRVRALAGAVVGSVIAATLSGGGGAAGAAAVDGVGSVPPAGRVFAEGTLRIGPPPAGATPRLRATAVLAVARQGESRQVRRSTPEVALGSFRVPTGVGARTENRLVWVVLFRGLVTSRVTPVVLGTRPRAMATTSPEARVDLLVIIDDATGTDVLRSEFASGAPALAALPR